MLRLSQKRGEFLRDLSIGLIGVIASVGVIVNSGMVGATGPSVAPCGIFCPGLPHVALIVVAVLLVASLLERTSFGQAAARGIDGTMEPVRRQSDRLICGACGLFFVVLWAKGGTVIGFDTATASSVVPLVQLGIALCMLWRGALIIGALGIAGLLGLTLQQFGAVPLLKDPVLIAMAAYLGMVGLHRNALSMRPLDVARWVLAAAMMGAAVESWIYPQGLSALLAIRPDDTQSYDELMNTGAGIAEFALSFALIWSPLCRRIAALVILGLFVGLMTRVGKGDAVEYLPVIVVLLAIAADDAEGRIVKRPIVWMPIGFAAALSATLAIAYVFHATILNTASL